MYISTVDICMYMYVYMYITVSYLIVYVYLAFILLLSCVFEVFDPSCCLLIDMSQNQVMDCWNNASYGVSFIVEFISAYPGIQ